MLRALMRTCVGHVTTRTARFGSKRLLHASVPRTSSNLSNPGPDETTRFDERFVEFLFNGKMLKLSNIWLRDHCRCHHCFHPTLMQRQISIQDLDLNIKVKDISRINNSVEVTWEDDHVSKYELEWLLENSYPGPSPKTRKFLWNKELVQQQTVTSITYNEFMSETRYVKQLLKNLLKFGFSFLVDAPATFNDTIKAAERIGFTMETFYGKNWQFQADMSRSDKTFTNLSLGAHTDTTFLPLPAGLQLLHCLKREGEGGNNLLVDGYYCAEKLRQTDRSAFDILQQERIIHEFFEFGTETNTACLESLIKTHPGTDELIWVRFCEFDRAPLTTMPQEKVLQYYQSMTKFARIIEDPANEYWIRLQPGTILFMDNWRVLNGRSSLTGNCHMCGTYLPREVWQGKAKLLGLL